MSNIAAHIRIFEASPTDDFVTKRVAVISALTDSFKKRSSYADLAGLANDIAGVFFTRAKLSDALTDQVAEAVSKESAAFDKDERTEEIAVLAALGGLGWLEGVGKSADNPSRADVFGLALWSALSFQKPLTNAKLEKLRQDLIEAARALVLASAENARQRKPVAEASVSLNDDETPSQIEKKITPGVVKVVNALRVNAALDREEIDVLWWSLSDWSETRGGRFSGLAPEEAALVGGIELAGLLKRLPADVHRHLMLRHVPNVAQKRDLAAFLEKTGEARASVAAKYKGNAMMEQNPHVFPLLNAVGGRDHKPTGAKASRTLDEWGARALLEAGLLHLSTLPNSIS